MLNGINNNELQQQQLSQTTGMDKTGLFSKNNPYAKIDKNLLVDQLDISQDAMKMYQRDLDIQRFTKLALSDPNDNSHNIKVASQIANGEIQLDEQSVLNNLFKNRHFFKDIIG